MPFVVKVRLPLYRGLSDLTLRITASDASVRLNGVADDAMADTASDGLFLATVAEDLVGRFAYEIFRAGATVQTGSLTRVADQASVLADDPADFIAAVQAGLATAANVQAVTASVVSAMSPGSDVPGL